MKIITSERLQNFRNLTLKPPSLEILICGKISLWKASIPDSWPKYWNRALKLLNLQIKDFLKDLLMKIVTSKQLAKIYLQILAWSRHARRQRVCKEISLCLEGIVFMRRSFYKSFIAMRGGFTTRFPGLGQRPGTDYFHKEILSQIFHFQAWRLRTRSQGFGHRFASDYDYFEKTWILSLLAPVSGFKVFAMAWKRFIFFVNAFL